MQASSIPGSTNPSYTVVLFSRHDGHREQMLHFPLLPLLVQTRLRVCMEHTVFGTNTQQSPRTGLSGDVLQPQYSGTRGIT